MINFICRNFCKVNCLKFLSQKFVLQLVSTNKVDTKENKMLTKKKLVFSTLSVNRLEFCYTISWLYLKFYTGPENGKK